jgi:hypothetical protein
MPNISTNGVLIANGIQIPVFSVNIGNIITLDSAGNIIPSNVQVTTITGQDQAILDALTSVTGNLQTQLNDISANYTMLSLTNSISSNMQTQINTLIEGLKEPTGFENRTDSSISFDIGTLTFSISGNHNIYSHGIKYSKSSATQVINNAVGAHYIYYDLNGNLTYSQTVWDLSTNIPITYIYLDSTLTKALLFEERHGSVMDAETHRYLHFTQGAQFKSGLTIADYVLNSDTVDDNKYSISSGEIFDEDILNSIPGIADGGPYKVAYRTGVNGEWTWSTTESYPYFINANSIRYNQYTGATWQLTDITTNNRWVNYYIIASNALNDGILIIPGQSIYTSLALAQAESIASLSLGNFPIVEAVAVYQVTHQFSTAYDNANGRARIVAVTNIKNQKLNATLISNNTHNNLSGLQGGVAGEYFHLTSSQYSDYIGKTEVSNISGQLQSQIDDKANATDLNNYTLSTTTDSITANLQSQINNILNNNIDINGIKTFTNDVIINGDLFVNGSQIIVNSTTVSTCDNVLFLNAGELGSGVTNISAGLLIDRGSLDNYAIIFDEISDSFKIGEINDLQKVATREDSPINGGVAIWNPTEYRFDTTNKYDTNIQNITANYTLLSTTAGLTANLQSQINNAVLLTGVQTISGEKTFLNNILIGAIKIGNGTTTPKNISIGDTYYNSQHANTIEALKLKTFQDSGNASGLTFTYDGSLAAQEYHADILIPNSTAQHRFYSGPNQIPLWTIDPNYCKTPGILKITNTTDTTAASEGSLQVYGGAYIAKSAIIGDTASVNNVALTVGNNQSGVAFLRASDGRPGGTPTYRKMAYLSIGGTQGQAYDSRLSIYGRQDNISTAPDNATYKFVNSNVADGYASEYTLFECNSSRFTIPTATTTGTITVTRQDLTAEGGEIQLCRATDNTNYYRIDCFGTTNTPNLRILNDYASLLEIDSNGFITINKFTGKCIQLGNYTGTSTSDPCQINLGGTYSDTAGSNLKIKMFDNGNSSLDYGFGVSASQLDIRAAGDADIAFWIATTEKFTIKNNGDLSLINNANIWLRGNGLTAGSVKILSASDNTCQISSNTSNGLLMKLDGLDTYLLIGTQISPGTNTSLNTERNINIIDSNYGYKVNDIQVVGGQQSAVADATGAGDIVAQFNTLLSRLRTHGLIAS